MPFSPLIRMVESVGATVPISVHHAPHGFAAAGDTVKMELAPVLGFQIHVFHDLSSSSQPTDRAPYHDASLNPDLLRTSYGALVPGYKIIVNRMLLGANPISSCCRLIQS